MSENLPEIPGYQLLRLLGAGGGGSVYLARQLSSDREVAVKILRSELAASETFVKDFLREARISARLCHPNIVQALEVGRSADGSYFFVMEFVEGESLEEYRKRCGKIALPELLKLSIELASALGYAWSSRKITHGDIKPGNLLLAGEAHTVKLADLGLARVQGNNLESEGDQLADLPMATPLYAPPEVIGKGGRSAGPQSDMYSFGVMFYELYCGHPPFSGSVQKLLDAHLYSQPPVLPEADPELAGFIDRLLSKVPADRPRSWEEIRTFLTTLQQKYFPVVPEENETLSPSPEKPEKKSFFHRLAPWLPVFGGAAAAALILWSTSLPQPDLARLTQPAVPAAVPAVAIKSVGEEKELMLIDRELHFKYSMPPLPPPEVPVRNQLLQQPERKAISVSPASKPAPAPEKLVRSIVKQVQTAPKALPKFDPMISQIQLQHLLAPAKKKLNRTFAKRPAKWKKESEKVLHQSLRLAIQLEPYCGPVRSIGRFSEEKGSAVRAHSAAGSSMVLSLGTNCVPQKIAAAVGQGVGLSACQRGMIPPQEVISFGDAFAYFVAERMNQPLPKFYNRFLMMSNYSLSRFVWFLHKKRMAQ